MPEKQLKYKVFVWSKSAQVIQLVLDPGQTITARAVIDNWIDDGIICGTRTDPTGNPDQGVLGKILKSGKKNLNRDPNQVVSFTNPGSGSKTVAFAAPAERQILPIPVSRKDGHFFCHKEAFICAESGVETNAESLGRPKSSFPGSGKSDWLLFGGDGMIFVHVGGTFKKKYIKNKILKIDRRSIVGFAGGITFDRGTANLSMANRSDTKLYFQTKLSGSGTVYLQSKPFRMPKHAQSLTRDLSELVNAKAVDLYKDNLAKIKNLQWSKVQDLVRKENLQLSKLQDLVKKENLQNTLKTKIDFRSRLKKLTAKKS